MHSKPQDAQQTIEDALRESEAKFRVLAETAASAIFIYQGTRFQYVNPALETLTGYSRDELLRMNFYDVIHPSVKKQMRGRGLQLQRGQIKSTRDELLIVTKEGEERWIDLVSGAIEYGGRPAGLGVALDITEHKRAEQLQDVVYRIAQVTGRARRLDDLFPVVHGLLREVMLAENFYVALYDTESNLLTFPYYVDHSNQIALPRALGKGLTEYVLRTGKPLLCTLEVYEELERKGEVEALEPRPQAWLGVPLMIEEMMIGVVAVQHYADNYAYGEREKCILEFAASQVALAVYRQHSEEALNRSGERYQHQAKEFAALYEVTRDIAMQRNLASLLNTISERVTSLMHASGCVIYLYDEGRDELDMVDVYGKKDFIGERIKVGEGLAGKVAQLRQPLIVDDYRTWDQHLTKFENLFPAAAAGVPMIFSGELVGVLAIYEFAPADETEQSAPRRYTQADVELLSFLARVAASAVNNSMLFEETRQRLIEIEVLYQASLAAAQIHSVKAVAQRTVEALEQLMKWQASIWVVDIERQRPILMAIGSGSITGEKLRAEIARINTLVTSIDQGIVGWVCKTGQAVRIGDTRTDPRYVEGRTDTRSELCVPLKVGGKTIGCINMENPAESAFGEHDERLLTTLANQAAIAMENARLFEETRRRALRQAALNTIITAASRSGSDLDAFLNTALEQILQALGLDMGALWLMASSNRIHRVAVRGMTQSIAAEMSRMSASGEAELVRTLVIDDWSTQGGPVSDMLRSMGVAASVSVPMYLGDTRIGGLSIATSQVHHWGEDEISLVETVVREVGTAAERARLFDETRSRLAELETVNRISTSLRLAHSLGEMLPSLMDETLRALAAEAGSICLYDALNDNLKLAAGRGWLTHFSDRDINSEQGIIGSVFITGDVYFSHEIAFDPLVYELEREFVPLGWSGLYVPIRAEQETIGVFMVSDQLPREFSAEDARLLVTLAEIVGNAIQRMRLLEQTERHATELEGRVAERTAELQQALQKAQTADQLKSEFIANVNHELRTPLTNLVLYYQMLRSQPTVRSEERLDVIGRELQRLRNLIEDLLNLSRMDLGQVVFHPLPRNINELVQPLVEDRRILAEERGLHLFVELIPNLPPVWVDEQMMVQAISNLLTNALNYTPRGGWVRVRTILDSRGDVQRVGYNVQDNGPGISKEEMPHLFDRFFRGKAGHESGTPGTGLGLAIVKQVAERHRGDIVMESGVSEGQGASFTIWLPATRNEPDKAGS